MKPKHLLLMLAIVATAVSQSIAQMTLPPNGNNQKSEVTQYLGLVKVTIEYRASLKTRFKFFHFLVYRICSLQS